MWPLILIAAAIGILAFSGTSHAATGPGGARPPPPPPPGPGVVPVVFPQGPSGTLPVVPVGPGGFIAPPSARNPSGLLTVTTNDPSPEGDLKVRSTPQVLSDDSNVVGTLQHRGLVRPDGPIGWDQGDGTLGPDPSGNFNPANGWYHVTDVGGIGSPQGVSGFASAAFLSLTA